MTDATAAPLLAVEDVAKRLGMSDSFVYAAIKAGRLRCYRLGRGQGGIRVGEAHLAAYLKACERGGGATPAPPPEPAKKKYRYLD